MNRYSLLRNQKLLWPLLWLCVIIVYMPAYRAGFFMDFLNAVKQYHEQGFFDFINSANEDYHSLYQVTQALLYAFFSIFGMHPIPWFLLFTGMHVCNGYLIYSFFGKLFSLIGWEKNDVSVFAGVCFFLFCPVVTQVVIWKAAYHYLNAVCIIFLILNCLLTYITTNRRACLWLIITAYCVSMFMVELFYLTPLFVFLTITSVWIAGRISNKAYGNSLLECLLPLVLLWCCHLALYHFVFHKWIAHYEVDIATAFHPLNITDQLIKYVLHIVSPERFLSYDIRRKLFAITGNHILLWIFTALMGGLVLLGVVRYKYAGSKLKAIIMLYIFGLLSCTLIIPMWYDEFTAVLNDRYYYLPSVFFFQILSGIIFYNRKLIKASYLLAALYFVYCIAGTFNIVWSYRVAAKVQTGIINNYHWQGSDTVLLLNLPNNYKGIFIIPSAPDELFNKNYQAFKGQRLQSKIYDVASYNIHDRWDGAHIIVVDSTTLKVIPDHYGSWWWMNTLGASDYENEIYQFRLFDNGCSYTLHFKQKPSSNIKILYQAGESWKELDMKKMNEEQW